MKSYEYKILAGDSKARILQAQYDLGRLQARAKIMEHCQNVAVLVLGVVALLGVVL